MPDYVYTYGNNTATTSTSTLEWYYVPVTQNTPVYPVPVTWSISEIDSIKDENERLLYWHTLSYWQGDAPYSHFALCDLS